MTSTGHDCKFNIAAAVRVFGLALIATLCPFAVAQSFHVLHTFAGPDGSNPQAGLTMDQAGNLYGTTSDAGRSWGTVFRLKAPDYQILERLYKFDGIHDAWPYSRVVFGPDGGLYGTTSQENGASTYGTIFELQPPPAPCHAISCPWTLTRIHTFQSQSDGYEPYWGRLVFDQAGNLYGTTKMGGLNGFGEVFELSPSAGGWTKTTLHAFGFEPNDGFYPTHGVVLDRVGNLYGTTYSGGSQGGGMVFKLSHAGGSWTETVLHNFSVLDIAGEYARSGLIMDAFGNLYGATSSWGGDGGGTVFEWNAVTGFTVIDRLFGQELQGPTANLAMDSSGNLYGATDSEGTNSLGSIFKLTRMPDGSWSYTDVHDFTGGADGSHPWGDLMIDGNGNIYGTTTQGGAGTCNRGVVWQITP